MSDEIVASIATHPTDADIKASQDKIEDLRAGLLPQMVNWWDASVLGIVAIRTLISGTIGSYADQRPMQAAADNIEEKVLVRRHDYRGVQRGGANHLGVPAFEGPIGTWNTVTDNVTKSLAFDGDAIWVDFIADLGDGYEATYAMAYLMAQDAITLDVPDEKNVPKPQRLPAGDVLIMGGDLAYPNATVEEYNRRCIDPYDDAFREKIPMRERVSTGKAAIAAAGADWFEDPLLRPKAKRKLFFIAGNHDWYDGLAAFTSVFCTARDRLAKGKGLTIGGWQTEQRRSYFALALPYGWWFWGVDLALNATIDEAQKNYFEAMSLQTRAGEKVIIIVHAPVWQTLDDSPLHDISQWARKNGAEVVALLAGDLHFYSRFKSIKPARTSDNGPVEPALEQELQLIVSGGGGAFLHPTHQIPHEMKVHWSVPKPSADIPRDRRGDFVETTVIAIDDAVEREFDEARPFDFHSPHIYPSRTRSMQLSLKNLLLPFRNRKFALFVGIFYLLYAWVFQITTQDPEMMLRRAKADNIKIICNLDKDTAADRAKCYEEGIKSLESKQDAVEATLDMKRTQQAQASRAAATAIRSAATDASADDLPLFGSALVAFVAKYPEILGANAAEELRQTLVAFESKGGWTGAAFGVWERIYSRIDTKHVINAMLSNPAFFFMIIGLYAGLIYYVGFDDGDFVRPSYLKWPVKIVVGGLHGWFHIVLLLALNGMLQGIYLHYTDVNITWPWQIYGVALYSALLIVIGGTVGGMLFGTYWVLASIVGKLHMDSFGALGIAGHKNFLRMKVEQDKITVFAIGLDKVPGRKGWRALEPKDIADGQNPLIKPIEELKPHLIEPPYEIRLTRPPPPLPSARKAVQSAPAARPEPVAAMAATTRPVSTPVWKSIWSPS